MTTSGAKANNITIKKSNTKEKANTVTKNSAKGNKTSFQTKVEYTKKLTNYLEKTSKKGGFDMNKAWALQVKAQLDTTLFLDMVKSYGFLKLKK